MSKKDELYLANLHASKGYSFWTATVFIVGEVAGVGLLSLPHATGQASWSGLAMIVYGAVSAAIAGLCLANSWLVLEERYPQYRQGLTRKPFATIGLHAFGQPMSVLLSVLMNVTRIGASVVILLLIASLVHSLTNNWIHLSHCQWIPIVSALLLFPLWLGSPADFWPVAYTAMLSTAVGTVLLVVHLTIELIHRGPASDLHVKSVERWASAFGTILFAFGGAAAFPNFQNDMKHKDAFPRSVLLGFVTLVLIYVPVAALGYAVTGLGASASIIDHLPSGVMVTLVTLCFLLHCLTAIFIVINPALLDLEELCRVPKYFHWKRCLLRTVTLLVITVIGVSVPSFGQILDLIGSSTIAAMSFVLPPILYVKLVYDQKQNPTWPQRTVPIYQLTGFALIVFVAVVGGTVSTFSVIRNWTQMHTSCYH